MKKTELNKMNGGGCVSKKRRLGIAFLSLFMTACLVTGGIFVAKKPATRLGDTLDWETNNNTASGSSLADLTASDVETYDERYELKDGVYSDAPTKKDIWLNKILSAGNNGKKVLATLGEDWVAAGGTIGYLGNADFLTIPTGYDITFDLAGHNLDKNTGATYTTESRHFIIQAGGSLTINDTVGGGQIKGSKAQSGTAGINLVSTATSQAKLTINGGIFTENYAGDAFGVVINARGIVVMNGGKITGNGRAGDGTPGIIGVGSSVTGHVGSFTMNGGEISNNVQSGGTITVGENGRDGSNIKELEFGTFVMNGGTIKNNRTCDSSFISVTDITNRNYGRGGGVNVVTSTSSFTMNGGLIYGNTTPYLAGGVNSVGTFTMNGGTIQKNKAGYYLDGTDTSYSACGGGVVTNGTFIMNGGTITENTSRIYAGGVYCSGAGASLVAKCEFNKGSITDNEAHGSSSSGGGIFLDANNSIVFKNVVVTGNKLPNSDAIGAGIMQ
ncbi:MAG: hypothetical protein K2N84_01960, partial [Clostridia bacterium]|nr:hypothetical protein [Clostridia bacterium]